MQTITLNTQNTEHIPGDTYRWTPPEDTDYDLVVDDGINIYCSGGITCGGNINCGGDITCDGYISCDGDIACRGNINCGGDITCDGYIACRGYITCSGNITCSGYINCRGYIACGGDITCDILYWHSMSMPCAGGEITARIIYPHASTRDHWAERLAGIADVSIGCYEELLNRIRPHLDEILALDKWSECERWIIASWRGGE